MTPHPLTVLQPLARVLRRAQTEPFSFTLFEGDVLVRNERYADPATHEYRVRLREGIPVSCTCPADEHYDSACKHRVAVAIRRPIIDEATRMQRRLVADGGHPDIEYPEEPDTVDSSEPPAAWNAEACDCDSLPLDFPCWECYRTGRRDLPK